MHPSIQLLGSELSVLQQNTQSANPHLIQQPFALLPLIKCNFFSRLRPIFRRSDQIFRRNGGLAPNPAHEAARLFELASKENFSNISDFFSGWQGHPSEEILTLVTKYKDFQESYARDISISGDFKPKCHPWLPGFYPAVDIIGLKGGYFQEGLKYSLPTAVLLKILIRTAYDQKTA